jgi:hypothetical protein
MKHPTILLVALAIAASAGGEALARPSTAARVEVWSCNGSPGPFRMRFSNFRPGPRGTRIADVSYPGDNGLEDARRLTIRGHRWRVGRYYDFVRSADGRHMNWVSPNTGDPIDCRRGD